MLKSRQFQRLSPLLLSPLSPLSSYLSLVLALLVFIMASAGHIRTTDAVDVYDILTYTYTYPGIVLRLFDFTNRLSWIFEMIINGLMSYRPNVVAHRGGLVVYKVF